MRGHSLQLDQLPHSPDVHVAPIAPRFSRSEPDRIDPCARPFPHAINPAMAKRLVERFRVRDAFISRAYPVERDDQLGTFRMVRLQPDLKRPRVGEMFLLHLDFGLLSRLQSNPRDYDRIVCYSHIGNLGRTWQKKLKY